MERTPIEVVEEESICLNDLIEETYKHLSKATQGLELLTEHWEDVSFVEQRDILIQCRYIKELLPFLIRRR